MGNLLFTKWQVDALCITDNKRFSVVTLCGNVKCYHSATFGNDIKEAGEMRGTRGISQRGC